MVTLKDIMMGTDKNVRTITLIKEPAILSDPRECAKDGNDNEKVGNDPSHDDCVMLYDMVTDDIYDLED